MKKSNFLFVLLSILSVLGYTQVSILNANINEYNITPNSLSQISVSNSGASGTAIIEVVLLNTANQTLLTAKSTPLEIKSGVTIFGYHNLKFSSIIYATSPQGNFVKNIHRLPSGGFNYCVKLTPIVGIEDGDELCQSISAVEDENLYLINPNDEDVIETVTPILLWMHTEPFNLLSPGEFFRMTLAEVKTGQAPAEAILINNPIFVKNHVSKHQVQYPLDAKKLAFGKTYAWMVQKISNGNILASTEIWSFSLENKPNPKEHMYIALKTKLDGSVYYVQDDMVYFRFDERYKSSAVDCKIYNEKREVITPSLSNEQENEEDVKAAGYNSYEMDLKPYKLKKGYYTLEALNEKKEKYYLKFYVE